MFWGDVWKKGLGKTTRRGRQTSSHTLTINGKEGGRNVEVSAPSICGGLKKATLGKIPETEKNFQRSF